MTRRTRFTGRERLLAVLALTLLALAAPATLAQAPSDAEVTAALKAAYAKYKTLEEGANADSIPALAKVDPKIYGIAPVTVDGKVYTEGDVASEVSIQSISKVFTMAKVIEESDPQSIVDNTGVDATGQVFISIVAIEQNKGAKMNPMVNPGAIAATSMVKGATYDEIWGKILGYYGNFAGRQLRVLEDVYKTPEEKQQEAMASKRLEMRAVLWTRVFREIDLRPM